MYSLHAKYAENALLITRFQLHTHLRADVYISYDGDAFMNILSSVMRRTYSMLETASLIRQAKLDRDILSMNDSMNTMKLIN